MSRSQDTQKVCSLVEKTQDIQASYIKFTVAVANIRGEDGLSEENIKKLQEAHQNLQKAVNSFPIDIASSSTSESSTPNKSREEPPKESRKRKRNLSSEITLEELKESIKFSSSPNISVQSLQSQKTVDDKINTLYHWEVEGSRLQARTALHSGYYLNLLRKKENLTTRQLVERFPGIPEP